MGLTRATGLVHATGPTSFPQVQAPKTQPPSPEEVRS